jgi:spermidine synthase
MQSTVQGDEAYHEGLVHPGMLAHVHPKRAAIIGGGEGATLREILRHDTIEHVKMIEIDAIMVSASREYLPSWNSCAGIAGSTPNCFDEPRADVRLEDALAWFISHFGPGVAPSEEEKFDVIIMDAL